jgi:hypothetical protein
MVEIDFKIVIVGLMCLTAIYITSIILNHENDTIGLFIVSIIALAIGVIIPSPRIDNKTGVLRW